MTSEQRLHIAQNSTSPQKLMRVFQDAIGCGELYAALVYRLVTNEHTPDEMLSLILSDGRLVSDHVFLAAVDNPNISTDTLDIMISKAKYLSTTYGVDVALAKIAKNPKTSVKGLIELSRSKTYYVRAAALANPNTPIQQVIEYINVSGIRLHSYVDIYRARKGF